MFKETLKSLIWLGVCSLPLAAHAGEVKFRDSCTDVCTGSSGGGCSSCSEGFLWGDDEPWALCSDPCSPIKVGGWIQAGYHDKATRLSLDHGDLLSFNDVPNHFNLHQGWVFAEKETNRDCCAWDWGFRVDFMYGTDAQKTQAFGGAGGGWDQPWDNGVYGWALPQAYVELANSDWSVKLGHFYTQIGYEVVAAPDNFFYSHSLTLFNSEPFTHTGAVAGYRLNDNIEVFGGWSAGWDTAFEQFQGGSNFLGGATWSLTENLSFAYFTTIGDFGWKGENAYMHSLVLDWSISDRIETIFQSDYLVGDNVPVPGKNIHPVTLFDHVETIGINQYLLYNLNDMLTVGGRVEWWRVAGISFYEITGGVNIRPHANFVIRPEYRYDWSPWGEQIIDYNAGVFGIDGIFTF